MSFHDCQRIHEENDKRHITHCPARKSVSTFPLRHRSHDTDEWCRGVVGYGFVFLFWIEMEDALCVALQRFFAQCLRLVMWCGSIFGLAHLHYCATAVSTYSYQKVSYSLPVSQLKRIIAYVMVRAVMVRRLVGTKGNISCLMVRQVIMPSTVFCWRTVAR